MDKNEFPTEIYLNDTRQAYINVYFMDHWILTLIFATLLIPFIFYFIHARKLASNYIQKLKNEQSRDYSIIDKSSYYQNWANKHFFLLLICGITYIGLFFIFPYMKHSYFKAHK